jgi:signal peptidase I
LLGTIVIALYVITFATQAFQIPSESMENTLLIGDYLLVDKVQFAPQGEWSGLEPHAPIERGDIIVFHYPVDPAQHFVKRVVGLPGDHIRLVNKRVWVNGRLLNDRAYAVYSPAAMLSAITSLPELRRCSWGRNGWLKCAATFATAS